MVLNLISYFNWIFYQLNILLIWKAHALRKYGELNCLVS